LIDNVWLALKESVVFKNIIEQWRKCMEGDGNVDVEKLPFLEVATFDSATLKRPTTFLGTPSWVSGKNVVGCRTFF